MKNAVENLQGHSSAVALKHYFKSTPDVRASFVSQNTMMVSPQKTSVNVPDDILKKRMITEEKEKAEVVDKAKKTLRGFNIQRKDGVGKYCKLSTVDRETAQKIFSKPDALMDSSLPFPGMLLRYLILLYIGSFNHVEYET